MEPKHPRQPQYRFVQGELRPRKFSETHRGPLFQYPRLESYCRRAEAREYGKARHRDEH
jgi:hypothetical protein